MQDKFFKIRINEKDFVVDEALEAFREVKESSQTLKNAIPVGQFRYNEGRWFILWDKDAGTYYNQQPKAAAAIPLSVQWLQVIFLNEQASEKEYLDLVILLSETLAIIRSRCAAGKFRKTDAGLKKWLSHFNKS